MESGKNTNPSLKEDIFCDEGGEALARVASLEAFKARLDGAWN